MSKKNNYRNMHLTDLRKEEKELRGFFQFYTILFVVFVVASSYTKIDYVIGSTFLIGFLALVNLITFRYVGLLIMLKEMGQ